MNNQHCDRQAAPDRITFSLGPSANSYWIVSLVEHRTRLHARRGMTIDNSSGCFYFIQNNTGTRCGIPARNRRQHHPEALLERLSSYV